MTPLQFEEQYESEWRELEELLAQLRGLRRRDGTPPAGERLAALYRRACEQLALARARAYPAYIVDRLDGMTTDAHQLIYQRKEVGLRRLAQLILQDIPRTVRAHARYVW